MAAVCASDRSQRTVLGGRGRAAPRRCRPPPAPGGWRSISARSPKMSPGCRARELGASRRPPGACRCRISPSDSRYSASPGTALLEQHGSRRTRFAPRARWRARRAVARQVAEERRAIVSASTPVLGPASRPAPLSAGAVGRRRPAARRAAARLLGSWALASATSAIDQAAADDVGQRLVHRDHPRLGARVDGAVDHEGLALADHVRDGGRHDHQLAARRRAPCRPCAAAGSARSRRRSELATCTRICACWWGGNTSMMRATVRRRVLRVQRAEAQVAGLGGGHARPIVSQVAHLADQDDVGILAQRGPAARSAND